VSDDNLDENPGDLFDEPPVSEMTPLLQETVQMHELFGSLLSAGFSEEQALRLVSLFFSMGDGFDVYVTETDDDDGELDE
jgi:hypothetical protein